MKFAALALFTPVRLALSVLAVASTLSATAHAGCGIYGSVPGAGLSPSAYSPAQSGATLHRTAADEEAIVGLWQVKIVAKGNSDVPDGVVLDQGYSVWHSDHTEILNSGRAPATGSFCLGVWKKTGASTYKLNHFALSWTKDARTGEPILQGPSNIKEEVVVDAKHETFTGSFVLDDYDTTGKLLAHHTAVITGKRLTLDSPVAPM